jgi:hypothetical protein
MQAPLVFGAHIGTASLPSLPVTFDHVRLYGGDLQAPSTNATGQRFPQSFALFAANAAIELHSSLLHGGGLGGTTPFPRTVALRAATSVKGDYTTLLSGLASLDPQSQVGAMNQVVFAMNGANIAVELTKSLLVGTDDVSYAISSGGDACHAVNDALPGFTFQTTDSVYVHHQKLNDLGAIPGTFAIGEPGCPTATTAFQATPEQTMGHLSGNLVQVVGAVDNEGTKAPLLAGCDDAASCLQTLFPKYTKKDKGQLIGVANVALRADCSTKVPNVVTGAGPATALSDEAKLDLVGKDRSTAARVGPGAFLSCP